VSSPPPEFQEISESEAKIGDVVVFGTGHMGINLNSKEVYSSQSEGKKPGPTKGLKEWFPGKRRYYRWK
jgi:hypothetical protein